MPSEPIVGERRIRLRYKPRQDDPSEAIELPLKILVIGDFRGPSAPTAIWSTVRVDRESLDRELWAMKVELTLAVRNLLDPSAGPLALRLPLASMRDLSPEGIIDNVAELRELRELRERIACLRGPWTSPSVPGFRALLLRALDPADLGSSARDERKHGVTGLIDRIVGESHLTPADTDAYEMLRDGVSTLLALSASEATPPSPAHKDVLDAILERIDGKLGLQLDEILHHPDFQSLESSWRGLAFLQERIDPSTNVLLECAHVTARGLYDDFEDSPSWSRTELHDILRPRTYDCAPYSLVCVLHEVTHRPEDIYLLRNLAAVAEAAHTAILLNAHPKMFLGDSFEDLLKIRDLQAVFEMPYYAHWNSFRATLMSRFIGVCLPRFLLRRPYRQHASRIQTFAYSERVGDSTADFLWGPAALVMASRIVDAFTHGGWCADITGPRSGGTERRLPAWRLQSGRTRQAVGPCDVLISDNFDQQLAELGFIPLVSRHDSDQAVFFSASSPYLAPNFMRTPEGERARARAVLNQRLPYTLIVAQVVHCLEALYEASPMLSHADLTQILSRWLQQYVNPVPDPPPELVARKPFRFARIQLEEGTPGRFRFRLDISPHLHHLDADLYVSTAGPLGRASPAKRGDG